MGLCDGSWQVLIGKSRIFLVHFPLPCLITEGYPILGGDGHENNCGGLDEILSIFK